MKLAASEEIRMTKKYQLFANFHDHPIIREMTHERLGHFKSTFLVILTIFAFQGQEPHLSSGWIQAKFHAENCHHIGHRKNSLNLFELGPVSVPLLHLDQYQLKSVIQRERSVADIYNTPISLGSLSLFSTHFYL